MAFTVKSKAPARPQQAPADQRQYSSIEEAHKALEVYEPAIWGDIKVGDIVELMDNSTVKIDYVTPIGGWHIWKDEDGKVRYKRTGNTEHTYGVSVVTAQGRVSNDKYIRRTDIRRVASRKGK